MTDEVVKSLLSRVRVSKSDESISEQLLSHCKLTQVAAGDVVITQGQQGSALFLLVSGTVEARSTNGNVVYTFNGPCRFGERTAFRTDEMTPVSCVVVSNNTVLFQISSDDVLKCVSLGLHPLQVKNDVVLFGKIKSDIVSFSGIRYASAERFGQPEVELMPRKSVLRILKGPSCPQLNLTDSFSSPMIPKPKSLPHDLLFLASDADGSSLISADKTPQTDDCLQLNVSMPKQQKKKMPVMVFIHGGAFIGGSASDSVYDGSELASHGIVVVLINYRLGPLGFLYTAGVSPNLGLQDQLAALMWVQLNCHYFGGDRDNVTVFGESAGGMSIGCLLGSSFRLNNPLGRTLFHKAIPQSGASLNAVSAHHGEETARLMAQDLEMDSLISIRNVSLSTLLDATESVAKSSVRRDDLYGKFMPFQPVVSDDRDPVFKGIDPHVAIDKGMARDVKLMTGINKDEFALFMMLGMGGESQVLKQGLERELVVKAMSKRLSGYLNDTSRYVHVHHHEERATQLVEEYAPTAAVLSKQQVHQLVEELNSAWLFELPCLRLVQSQSKYNDVYMYRLDMEAAMPKLKACHALDLPLLFGTWKHPIIGMLTGSDAKVELISKAMQLAWTSFAKYGVPDAGSLRWPTINNRDPKLLVFEDTGGVTVAPVPRKLTNSWRGICVSKL